MLLLPLLLVMDMIIVITCIHSIAKMASLSSSRGVDVKAATSSVMSNIGGSAKYLACTVAGAVGAVLIYKYFNEKENDLNRRLKRIHKRGERATKPWLTHHLLMNHLQINGCGCMISRTKGRVCPRA
jgi:hypothetical protein